MRDQLAGTGPAGREAEAKNDVVQPPFHDAQEHLAGVLWRPRGQLEIPAELPLEDAVKAFELLLLAQAGAVLARLAAPVAVHSRRLIAPLDGTLGAVAAAALQVQLHAFTAAQFADRIEMTSHGLRLIISH